MEKIKRSRQDKPCTDVSRSKNDEKSYETKANKSTKSQSPSSSSSNAIDHLNAGKHPFDKVKVSKEIVWISFRKCLWINLV